ncbi:MAG TPA: 30S ribosome-binding factor RbfA [Chloroflexota bacterium]|nr:30S ribosome-binding factor RbfA [Chloroflexota bacterium]
MPNRRIERINHLLRQEIAELLSREVKDSTLSTSLISITEVDTSPDLRNAKVYFSVYGDEDEIKAAGDHLRRAAGFLHHNLKERLDLRHTPHLEFVVDRSIARGDRIMRLMRTIEEEREQPHE